MYVIEFGFCPKSDFDIAPNTYQKMNLKFINKLYEDLKEIGFQGAFSICDMANHCYIKISPICKYYW